MKLASIVDNSTERKSAYSARLRSSKVDRLAELIQAKTGTEVGSAGKVIEIAVELALNLLGGEDGKKY